ncbi:hypothetical protein CCZ01_06090 [Helicobacter monodelphidis]|uniref:DUF7149 domain-containing protein n=1 Tax=Helicobacter sp. 15-1451 TaxID=2004995 RepID=UPI000DCF31E5|nr:hypothetical protein [Helicobacter sp. 15-1451]RAX57405.1 hypothetical protein CCZ01_06090 [Helicobacter sp. 15-1451]
MLKFNSIPPEQFLDVYAATPKKYENFQQSLKNYLEYLKSNKTDSERALVSNALKNFFEQLGFKTKVEQTSGKGNSNIDLALMCNDRVKVLIEAKKPNSKDFFSSNNVNCKALHEAILYYFREREQNNYP